MDFLKTAFNFASEAAQNYYTNYQKQQKMRQALLTCTYTDDVKMVIQKAVKQVFNVYPNFNSDVLEFTDKGQKKRYLQLKCIMDIEIRGKVCKVDFNMMLPVNFPKRPPYVRIVNQSNQYRVQPFYRNLQSPTDPKSYILNQKLTQVKNWDQTKSIVNIIIQAQNMMRQNFPFVKQTQNNKTNVHPGWGNVNNNNNYNQYGGNNNNYGFQNNSNNYNNSQKSRPPIPFSTANIQESIENGQKFVTQSKKMIEKLKTQHIKSVQKIQILQVMKTCLESQQEYLRHQNLKITDFLHRNQKANINDLCSLIKIKDEKSEQILDLTVNIRAKDDCIALLQSKFNEGDINFNDFMKHARKLQEQKFQDKFLLCKCIQKVK